MSTQSSVQEVGSRDQEYRGHGKYIGSVPALSGEEALVRVTNNRVLAQFDNMALGAWAEGWHSFAWAEFQVDHWHGDDALWFYHTHCEEASVLSRGEYIPCGKSAVAELYSDKDGRSYKMCMQCAYHNQRRGMEVRKWANDAVATMLVKK